MSNCTSDLRDPVHPARHPASARNTFRPAAGAALADGRGNRLARRRTDISRGLRRVIACPEATAVYRGNADCYRIDLANGEKLSFDYADMRCADDSSDRCIDLPA